MCQGVYLIWAKNEFSDLIIFFALLIVFYKLYISDIVSYHFSVTIICESTVEEDQTTRWDQVKEWHWSQLSFFDDINRSTISMYSIISIWCLKNIFPTLKKNFSINKCFLVLFSFRFLVQSRSLWCIIYVQDDRCASFEGKEDNPWTKHRSHLNLFHHHWTLNRIRLFILITFRPSSSISNENPVTQYSFHQN